MVRDFKKIVRKCFVLALVSFLFFASPGFKSYQALAETINSRDFTVPSAETFVLQNGNSLQLSLPFPTTEPEFNLPADSSLELNSPITLELSQYFAKPILKSKNPSTLGSAKKLLRTGQTLLKLQKNIALVGAKLQNPSSSAASSFSVGRKIWDIVSGRKSSTPNDVSNAEPVPSREFLNAVKTPRRLEDGFARPFLTQESVPNIESPDAILSDLREHPPAAVFFDYDKTLTDINDKGMSGPTPEDIIENLKKLLKAGWPIGIITGRAFDQQARGVAFSNTIWEPLISKIPESLRKNLFFVGGFGEEFIVFKNGKPVRYLSRDWNAHEKTAVSNAVFASLKELQIPLDSVDVNLNIPAQALIAFKQRGDPKIPPFAGLLDQKLKQAGFAYPVLFGGSSVYCSKFDKGIGASLIYAVMRDRGFPVTESNLLIVGDDFSIFPSGAIGGDARMAMAFPQSRALSVAEKIEGSFPDNVLWFGGPNTKGSRRVIAELLKISPPQSNRKIAMSFFMRMSAFFGASFAGILSLILSQHLFHVHFLTIAGPVDFLGTMGSFLLTALGLPQLFKNFHLKNAGTRDLSLKSNFLWFGASLFLLAVSLLKHSSPLWQLINVAGVLESASVIAQMLFYNRLGGRFSALAGAALAIPTALALSGALFSPTLWASVLFWTAIGLLTAINIPQIKTNFQLYQRERRAPSGISPLTPALVVAGSLLSLVSAVSRKDLYWILTNVISVAMCLLVLAQIYIPAKTSSIFEKIKKKE